MTVHVSLDRVAPANPTALGYSRRAIYLQQIHDTLL